MPTPELRVEVTRGGLPESVHRVAAAIMDSEGRLIASSGNPDLITQAFMCTRAGGATIAVGVPRSDAMVTIPSFPLILQEKRLLGTGFKKKDGSPLSRA